MIMKLSHCLCCFYLVDKLLRDWFLAIDFLKFVVQDRFEESIFGFN